MNRKCSPVIGLHFSDSQKVFLRKRRSRKAFPFGEGGTAVRR